NVSPQGIEVPVGHGFCIYIRRACISAVGLFDEVTFGRGYSEEVDFCLRARKKGFIHLAATDVLVGHVGEVSFKSESNERRERARKIIDERYPGYFQEVRRFVEQRAFEPYQKLLEI